MNWLRVLLVSAWMAGAVAQAAVAPAVVNVPQSQAWTGQRVQFFVEVRALGSFVGTASFDLPQLPRTTVIKIGNPVVSSEVRGGETWFVQTHEFALFSQRNGRLDVPAFAARFAARDGFTGPAADIAAQVPGWHVEIRRPPGSDGIGFLITAPMLDVSETWEPRPGPAQVGAIFKRTIVQRAEQVPGMALAPAPTTAPGGVRVYAGAPQTRDDLERGAFVGERRDTVTYLVMQPGVVTLPPIRYVWWDPERQELQSTTLAGVTIDIRAAPAPSQTHTHRSWWTWFAVAGGLLGIVVWQRVRLHQLWRALNPPDRAAERAVLRACRGHDAAAAESAWTAWCNTQATFEAEPALAAALLELRRLRFGSAVSHPWRGDALARAFRETLSAAKTAPFQLSAPVLPALNP